MTKPCIYRKTLISSGLRFCPIIGKESIVNNTIINSMLKNWKKTSENLRIRIFYTKGNCFLK